MARLSDPVKTAIAVLASDTPVLTTHQEGALEDILGCPDCRREIKKELGEDAVCRVYRRLEAEGQKCELRKLTVRAMNAHLYSCNTCSDSSTS